LKQWGEARKLLQSAVAWMGRGTLPLDHQTAHELTALRAEVEQALLARKP
jgi:hypothetical protein